MDVHFLYYSFGGIKAKKYVLLETSIFFFYFRCSFTIFFALVVFYYMLVDASCDKCLRIPSVLS